MGTSGPQNPEQPPPAGGGQSSVGANPLLRRSDRIESWFTVLVLWVLLLGLPGVSFAVGWANYSGHLDHVHAQAAQRHQVDARLTGDASGTGHPGPHGETFQAPVRWHDRGGAARTGTAHVPSGTRDGQTVRIWVDRHGSVASPPAGANDAEASGWLAGLTTAVGITLGALGAQTTVRCVLDHRRYRQWDAEWAQFEPRWSRRLHG